MKDLFQNYHRHKVLSNLWILSLSAILAISINSFVLSGETWDMLKANILESSIEHDVDLDFLATTNDENKIIFQNTQEMTNVTEMSFSLAYDNESLTIWWDISEIDGATVTKIENQAWFITYILNFTEPQNIEANTAIATLDSQKLSETTTHINIINVNFTDSSGEVFMLSTTGIML